MTRADTLFKSDSQTPVTMLTEVENIINVFFDDFEKFQKEDEATYNDEQRQLKKYNRGKAAEENIASLKAAIEEKN